MELVVGDIGNTFCKICLVSEKKNKITKVFNLRTKSIKTVKDLKIFSKKKKFLYKDLLLKKALFASVVPSVFSLFKIFLDTHQNICHDLIQYQFQVIICKKLVLIQN